MNSQTETQAQDSLTEEEALSAAEQEEIIDRFLNSATGTLMQLGVLVLGSGSRPR